MTVALKSDEEQIPEFSVLAKKLKTEDC